MFQRHHGSGRTALDAVGIVNPVVRDFISVRFQKDKTHITGTFMYPEESINEAVIRIADALERIASVMGRQPD